MQIRQNEKKQQRTYTVDTDEGPRRGTNMEALARLKPVFAAGGSVTAGNSSQTSDGAAFVIVMSEKMVKESPCKMKIYDYMEEKGNDLRSLSLIERRNRLPNLSDPFLLSEKLNISNLEALNTYMEAARANRIEGVMIKHKQSPYKSGRIRGDWWKLKIDPLVLDVVIMYAQKGRGVRSGLYTDYTFGVWDNDQLVPIGKAYSGLTNNEIKEVNTIIKRNVTDKFGPVRGVAPCVVLEIACDDIHVSPRHKSGLALRFPRIQRLRLDKPVEEANTLTEVRALCNQ